MVSLRSYQTQTTDRLIAGSGILVRIKARSIHNFISEIRRLLDWLAYRILKQHDLSLWEKIFAQKTRTTDS